MIDGSSRVQHRIELFALGLKSGTRANLPNLADRRAALEKYRTRWESLEHAERVSVNTGERRAEVLDPVIVYQVSTQERCKYCFIQAPLPSKGLPQKEWVISNMPDERFYCAAVQPIHDLVVMVAYRPGIIYRCVRSEDPTQLLTIGRYEIQCLQLSTGLPHPRARSFPLETFGRSLNIKVTGHRLAALRNQLGNHQNRSLIIWDWESGDVICVKLFLVDTVSRIDTCFPIQNTEAHFSSAFYFIDDYRLAILKLSGLFARSDSLVIYDTNRFREDPPLVLRLPKDASAGDFYGPGEAPDSAEALFTGNREQSLLAINMESPTLNLAFRSLLIVTIKDLLTLVSGGGKKTVKFDGWKHLAHRVQVLRHPIWDVNAVGVCGPAVLILEPHTPPARYRLTICDFSPDACRTNLASGQRCPYTIRYHTFQVQEAPDDNGDCWTILSEGLLLCQVGGTFVGL